MKRTTEINGVTVRWCHLHVTFKSEKKGDGRSVDGVIFKRIHLTHMLWMQT